MMFVMTAKAQSVAVTGAGATFPAPLYYAWAAQAEKEIGVKINYQSIGSGAGINQIRARTVTFGATDMPLEDPGDMFQFPTVAGRVVPVYNLPGVTNLKLNMPTIVKIYQGEITTWNDRQIAALNPGVNLPRVAIVPIYRADGSGTTFIWTRGMRDSNAGWNDVGTSVRWPTGQGARGNEGVAATVQRVRGSIGYVEYIYSVNNNIPFAGGFDPPAGRTFILLPKEPKDRAAHNEAVRFFEWCLTKGQDIAKSMHYYTLPNEESIKIIADLKRI
jgi:phosphate transport system substrate-binding protein